MSRQAQNSWRARVYRLSLLALPLLALSGCGSKEDALAEQLAAAEAAADRAVAAQHAAEKAAAIAAGIRPAPPAAEPTVMDDTDFDHENLDGGEDDRPPEDEFSMGGSGQTISPDGVVIPGQGA